MAYQVTRSDGGAWIVKCHGNILHTCESCKDADHYVEACERMNARLNNPGFYSDFWENF